MNHSDFRNQTKRLMQDIEMAIARFDINVREIEVYESTIQQQLQEGIKREISQLERENTALEDEVQQLHTKMHKN